MSILVVSPRVEGHANAILQLIEILERTYPFPVSIYWIAQTSPEKMENQTHLFTSAIFNLQLIEKIHPPANVQLVIYDYYAMEGYLYAQKYQKPYIASIPAILSSSLTKPNFTSEQIEKLVALADKLKIPHFQEKIININNIWLIPGNYNLVWSYMSLYSQEITTMKRYYFVGSRAQWSKKIDSTLRKKQKIPQVLCSFGKLIPESLYNSHRALRIYIISLYQKIINIMAKDHPTYQLLLSVPKIFATELKALTNTRIETDIQPLQELSKSILFITHGGGNSFNEAITTSCPLIVIPFFWGSTFSESIY